MKAFTLELRSHEQLKKILELSLKLNGFDVQLNPTNGHKLQKGQGLYDSPISTVELKTTSGYCKFLHDTRDGYGKVNMTDSMADALIEELERRVNSAKPRENQEAYKP